MKYFLVLLFLIFSINTFSMSGLEVYLMELQYKYEMMNGNKNQKPFLPEIECPKLFEKEFKNWQSNPKSKNDEFILAGEMEKNFTEEEILNMPNVNPHGILSNVRGNDKVTTGGFVYGGTPSFPHSYPGCENYFTEKVSIINEGGKHCRLIKLIDPKTNNWYSQKYCSGATHLFIHIEAPQVSESNCFAGKDLILCNH